MAYTTIDDPSLYFTTKLYTSTYSSGSGSGATINVTLDATNDFAVDLVWIKCRSVGDNHLIADRVRGANKNLHPNTTDAETTNTDEVTAFGDDGFTVGNNDTVNRDGASSPYVAWCWKAGGGSGSSNEDGSINTTSTSVSTTAGFSISKFTGTNSNATVGHGLGAAPTLIIIKNLGTTEHWGVGATALNNWNNYIPLSDADVSYNDATMWNDTAPTSTVFSVGTGNITNDQESMVAYCFAPKQGFSKFGSYTGNGNADGVFVHLGFRPALIIIKRTNSSAWWVLKDGKRSHSGGNNVNKYILYPNDDDAEGTDSNHMDLLSNGFKYRDTASAGNASGAPYIYMAWAEAPFVNSKGVPCNAK